ncbi:MAG: hypothetical protein MI739_02060, partial [Bacteroidales bacterium]|nr:hypothetical protein [Bacteroidales bacterium]
MRKILDKYFRTNSWLIFIIIIGLYFIALGVEFKYIFTEDFYLDAFKGQNNLENIYEFIAKDKSSEWVNFPIVLIIVLVPTLIIAFILNLGAALKEYKFRFTSLFKISLKAQMVFAINYLVITILKVFNLLDRHYDNINNNYDFQSLLIFFKDKKLPLTVRYFLQYINISEITYILLLAYGFSWLSKQAYSKSLGFVSIFYGITMFIWIIFIIFMQIIA